MKRVNSLSLSVACILFQLIPIDSEIAAETLPVIKSRTRTGSISLLKSQHLSM
jgi:hypothetical protein